MEENPFENSNFTYKTKDKCISKTRRLMRITDMYALPISLRYKSEKKFFTNFGAVTTITLMAVLALLLVGGL